MSKKFQEMTTRRIVSIVLICIMVTPFVSDENDLYLETSTVADHTIAVLSTELEFNKDFFQLYKQCPDRDNYKQKFNQMPQVNTIIDKVRKYQDLYPSKFIDILLKNCSSKRYDIVYAFQNAKTVRLSDTEMFMSATNEYLSLRVNIYKQNQLYSIFSLLKTTFICFLLVLMSLAISKDAQELVLSPLETIMEKVNRMAVDPFQVIFFNDENNNDD